MAMDHEPFMTSRECETLRQDTQRQLNDLAAQSKEADKNLNALRVDVGKMFGMLSLYQKIVVPLLTLVIGLMFGHFYL